MSENIARAHTIFLLTLFFCRWRAHLLLLIIFLTMGMNSSAKTFLNFWRKIKEKYLKRDAVNLPPRHYMGTFDTPLSFDA